jgi:DNA-binding transcriptional ArsR family regulator
MFRIPAERFRMASRDKSFKIRGFILKNAGDHPRAVGILTAEHFGISRQAVSRHLKILIAEGLLIAVGNTRSREYRLRNRSLHPEQIEILRGKSPAEKLDLALRLRDAAFELKAAYLSRRNPGWSDELVREKVKEAFLYART